MRALDRRPLGAFAFSFYISSCILYAAGGEIGAWLAPLLLAVFGFLLFDNVKIPLRRGFTAISAGILAASLLSGFVFDVHIASAKMLDGQKRRITATVTDVRYASSWEGCYTVSADGQKLILYSDECELRRGDVIDCTVMYSALDTTGDSREYLLSDGIMLTAETVDEVIVKGYSHGGGGFFESLRDHLGERLRSVMPQKESGFAAALVLGDRRGLDGGVVRDFRALGISHILAVSGTHLSVLFFASDRLLCGKNKVRRALALCPLVLFYMFLTGLSSSISRAGTMMILASLGLAVNKRSDSFTTLSVSAMIICAIDPMAPFDAGLQLSFASVMGLIASKAISRIIVKGKNKTVTSVLCKVITAFAVPTAVLPLMWIRFGEISLISPATNLILVPLGAILVPAVAVLLLLSPFKWLFVPLSAAVCGMISAFLYVVSRISAFADFILPISGTVTSVLMLVFVITAVTAALFHGRLRHGFAAGSAVFLALALLSSQLTVFVRNSGMTVCYASSSKDEALCAVSEGYGVLVDSGHYPSALKSAADMGLSVGVGSFDALILTRVYESHRLVLSSILSEYYIDSLWLPVGDGSSEDTLENLYSEAVLCGIPVYMYLPGERLTFGDCIFEAADHGIFQDGASFSLSYGDNTLCMTGSSDAKGDFNIFASHGADLSSRALGEDGGAWLISPKGASSLAAVSEGVRICDSAIIYFTEASAPRVRYPQERIQ